MAIDEYFFLKKKATIRFYQFNNSITIGKNCNYETIKLNECKKNNIDIARRPTGGNIVYHDNSDFTYSIIAPNKLFKMNDSQIYNKNAYEIICNWIIKTINSFELNSQLDGNNILINNQKVCGSSQICKQEFFLQHGSIFFNSDENKWSEYINFDQELKKDITHLKIDFNKFRDKLLENFVQNELVSDIEIKPITKEEWKEINQLIEKNKNKELENTKNNIGIKKTICAIDHISSIK